MAPERLHELRYCLRLRETTDTERIGDGDMRALLDHVDALLAHVDALQAQIDETRSVTVRTLHHALSLSTLKAHDAIHLLAWQQARVLGLRAGNDWLQDRSVPDLAMEVQLLRAALSETGGER